MESINLFTPEDVTGKELEIEKKNLLKEKVPYFTLLRTREL